MSEPLYLSHLFAKARDMGAPFAGTFELTSRCNLDCEMCYIHRRENDGKAKSMELSAAQWLDIARAACNEGTVMLLLTGGEPLLHPDFEEIYRECSKMGMLVSINTNGTMITEDIMKLFSECPPSKINVSLYGTSSDTYERLCGNGGMYERVTAAIDELNAAGINIKLNFSATRQNKNNLEDVLAYAKDRHLSVQTATYMFPPTRACEGFYGTNCGRMTATEAGKAATHVMRGQNSTESFADFAKKLASADSTVMHNCDERDESGMLCRAGRCTFWITCDGAMLPCGMMNEPRVRLVGDSFARVWNEIKNKTAEIRLPSECEVCSSRKLCEVCAASCFAETGSFEGVPIYQCEKTAAFIAAVKNIADGERGAVK